MNPHVPAAPAAPADPSTGSCADPSPGSAPFSRLPLAPQVVANLTQLGYVDMTPVQAAALPLALAGHDLVAQAKTGSGKTAAFALAMLDKLNPRHFGIQALVLCPTRELAEQVAVETRRLARCEENVKVLTIAGGVPVRGQLASLEHGAHVIVGTTGRVLDLLERQALDLSGLKTLVLDEADRMLDMGFLDDIRAIAGACPKARQTLLFSATFPDGIVALSRQFMRDPRRVELESRHGAAQIRQLWYEVAPTQRLHAVGRLLRHFQPAGTLAFCNTRQQCRDLVDVLTAQGIQAAALHGDMEQRDRDQVLIRFANRSCSVLVATDVAARGLDIAQLEAVINVDVTFEPEVHVHRVGRTGRAGEHGLALNLASMEEMGRVGQIELIQRAQTRWHRLDELDEGSDQPLVAPMVTLQILGGRKEKIRPGDVLGALTKDMGFEGARIGKINVTDMSTYVAVERSIADRALAKLNSGLVKGRRVRARRIDGDAP
ncbi:MAG: ATP-dependent RNA helicase DbpA [Burkholderiaceae bacterium]